MQMNKSVEVMLNDEGTVPDAEVVLLGDKSTLSSTRILRDTGEMIAPATIARTGVMLYKAKELGGLFADRDPESVIRVMTTPEVLFDAATIEGMRSIPLTINHPKDDVNIGNNKELQKGFLEGTPFPDGSALAGHIVINDAAAIRLVDSGVDQISLGHKSKLVRVDDNPDYECLKTTIVPNHIAIVRNGRAQTTRIGDSGEEIAIVDRDAFIQVEAERDALAEKVSTLEAKLADASAQALTEDAIQAEVAARVKTRNALMAQVASLGDSVPEADYSAMSDAEVKRHVVASLSDKDMSGRDDLYINTRFEIALEDHEASGPSASEVLALSLLHDQKSVEEARKPSPRQEALARREARYNK